MSPKKVMVVDDEEINLDILEGVLEDNFQVATYTRGIDCINDFEELSPDIVLLDVEMPDQSGLDVCRQLIAIKPNCPIIFISAKGSTQERLDGYDAGGYDYIVKPINGQELLKKLLLVTKIQEETQTITTQLEGTSNAFVQALNGSGELGVILRFANELFKANSYRELANKLLSTIQQLGARAAVRLSGESDELYLSTGGQCSPMEKEIIELLKDKGRIFDFKKRTQVNEKHVNLLLTQMPENPDEYGRLKDNIHVLLQLANAKVNNLDLLARYNRGKDLTSAIQDISKQLFDIDDKLTDSHASIIVLMEELLIHFENQIQFLALSEDQEDKLTSLLTKKLDIVREEVLRADTVGETFSSIVNQLKELI